MTRWQYRIVRLGAIRQQARLVAAFAILGEDGWELAAMYDKASNLFQGIEGGFALFKRPVPEGESPDGPWAEAIEAEDFVPPDETPDGRDWRLFRKD